MYLGVCVRHTCACARMGVCGHAWALLVCACSRVCVRVSLLTRWCVCVLARASVCVCARACVCACGREGAHKDALMSDAAHVCACTYSSDSATRLAGVKKPWPPFGVRTYHSCCKSPCGTTSRCRFGHRQGEERGSCSRSVERAGGSGATRTDLRHDGNDDENGDREDEHDQRPGDGMPRRDMPSRDLARVAVLTSIETSGERTSVPESAVARRLPQRPKSPAGPPQTQATEHRSYAAARLAGGGSCRS